MMTKGTWKNKTTKMSITKEYLRKNPSSSYREFVAYCKDNDLTDYKGELPKSPYYRSMKSIEKKRVEDRHRLLTL